MRTAGMIDDLSDAALHCPSFSLLWPTIDRSWVWSPVRERDQTRGSPRWHSRFRDVQQLRHCDEQTFVSSRATN